VERSEAEAVYDAGREACVEFLVELSARYERQIARLEARIARLEERERQNSTNSSRPPSSDPPETRPYRKHRAGRNPGGQPGHRGTARELIANVESVVDHWPDVCSSCGRKLRESDRLQAGDPYRHQVFELPPTAVVVTEHRGHVVCCPACAKRTRASLPAEAAGSPFGIRLQAAIALLSVRHRVSRRGVSELAAELFGCHLSIGAVDAICQRASAALADPYLELRAEVKDAPVVCVDETGWRQAGHKRTLWGAITDRYAAFHISADRHERELPEMIGEDFGGIVSSDRWWAYDQLDPARRQVCWSHLLRDFRAHAEGLSDQGRFGQAGLEICRELFGAWERFSEHGDRAKLAEEIEPLRRRLEVTLKRASAKSVRSRHHRRFARNLLRLWPALWTFTEVDGVEPTNNAAERGLRSAVIYRKVSLGSQSDAGERFAERMLSVSQTCRLQRRSLFRYIVDALDAHSRGSPAPALV
jgi:transposase